MSAQLRLHFIVFLWGFTAVLGKLISLDANHLVWYRMGLTSVFLIAFITFFQKESIFVRRDLAVKLVGVGSLMAIHWLLFFSFD